MEDTCYFYSLVETARGAAAVVRRQDRDRLPVCRIFLPAEKGEVLARVAGEFPGAVFTPAGDGKICSLISGLFDGKEVVFDPADIDVGIVKGFARRVLTRIGEIPRGYVMTYGGMAVSLGVPGGARAVGNALAGNPFPLFFPCHRVIRGDGRLGGFGGGAALKRALLEGEGVSFDRRGRVMPDCIVGNMHPLRGQTGS